MKTWIQAKELVETRIERSEFRRDQASVAFYRNYQDHTYALIKQQRMYYQQLFLKEKNFKKEFEKYTGPAQPESFQTAHRMVNLAIEIRPGKQPYRNIKISRGLYLAYYRCTYL